MHWAPDGSAALIQTGNFHDESGNSYYGQSNLQFFNTSDKKINQVHFHDGPLHDVAWSPDSNNFVIVSGFMPAYSIIYDKQCKPFFEFGKHHRNTIKFSPFSRFMSLSGFGNLNGEIDVWDLKQMKIVGTCKSSSAVNLIWSPDGRQHMTATLFPRLRVENNLKIFYYSGFFVLL